MSMQAIQPEPTPSTLRQACTDRVLLVFAGLCILSLAPYFTLLHTDSRHDALTWSWVQASVLILPTLTVLLWPRREAGMSDAERSFWKFLSLAYFLWWVAGTVKLLLTWDMASSEIDVVTSLNFLFFYLVWLIALDCLPHHATNEDAADANQRYVLLGNLVLAACLFVYFILIPRQDLSGGHDLWIRTFLFYAGLDALVIMVLLRSWLDAVSNRWKAIYAVFLVSMLGFLALDILEALNFPARFPTAAAQMDPWWTIPFFLVALAARMRGYAITGTPRLHPKRTADHHQPRLLDGSFFLAALFLLVLHISLEIMGLVEDDLRRQQSLVVAFGLLVLLLLAVAENRSWRRIARQSRERAEALQRLHIAQQVDERSEKAKSRFLANVSHEMRTPMNGILGMSEIVLLDDLSAEQRARMELLHSSAQGLLQIIDDILEYSKVETGEVRFVEKPFELEQLFRQVIDLALTAAGHKDIETSLQIAEDVPPAVLGDASRLRQVLLNLLANAVKFTDRGTIRVRLSVADRNGPKVRLRCEVSDTGIGIAPEVLPRLFIPFSQGDDSAARKFGGSGLGLAISRGIVEAQSGSIGACDNPGQGATFWFEIPYRVATAPQAQPAPATQPPPDSRHVHILLAEDDPTNQDVALRQLHALGLTNVDVVSDGRQVLDAVARNDYTLILMDCRMPGLDGYGAARELRRRGQHSGRLPIIALTAQAFEEDRQRCLDAGMNDYIAKPVKLDGLRAVLDAWLPQRDDAPPTRQ